MPWPTSSFSRAQQIYFYDFIIELSVIGALYFRQQKINEWIVYGQKHANR